MKALSNPLKRLAFVLFVVSVAVLIGLTILPKPFTVVSFLRWRDATGEERAERRVTRIDTNCAGSIVGGVASFARDFFVLASAENAYSGLLMLESVDRGEEVTIAETIDVTDDEDASIRSQLSSKPAVCIRSDACVEILTHQSFAKIFAECGAVVGQLQYATRSGMAWELADNFERHAPWSWFAVTLSVLFLSLSLLYNKTVGRLVHWIRNG